MVSSRRIPLERFNSEDVSKDSSSDNAKGNSSMVDPSLTEDKYGIENCNDHPGSSSSKENLECYPRGAERQLNHQKGVGNLGSVKTNRLHSTRYFIIKSLNHHNIELSIERGIWATQVMNEPILEEAFDNSSRVILIFSVNMSGCFQGYAQMMSSVGWRRDNVWSEAAGGTIPWGRSFKVNWLQLHNLPFQKTLHLKNPLNDYKPVKISRDCQELTQDIGEALCGLIDESVDLDERLKRNNFYGDDLHLKRPCMDFPACLPDEEYVHTVPPPSHMGWGRAPVLHPFLSYQKVTQAEASNLHIPHGRSPGRYLPENVLSNIEGSKVSPMKLTHTHGYPTNVQRDRDSFFQPDNRNLSSTQGFVADTLSEDDFLEMTYEEYVEAIGRRNNSSHRMAVGPCWSKQEASTSREHEHDYYRYF